MKIWGGVQPLRKAVVFFAVIFFVCLVLLGILQLLHIPLLKTRGYPTDCDPSTIRASQGAGAADLHGANACQVVKSLCSGSDITMDSHGFPSRTDRYQRYGLLRGELQAYRNQSRQLSISSDECFSGGPIIQAELYVF